MKKKFSFLTLLLSLVATVQDVSTVSAQSSAENTAYNKWSVEINYGFNKPIRTLTARYNTPTLNPTHIDLGARYMLSPKFGWKLDFGYDKFNERDNTPSFESTYLRSSLQAVINLGRALNFETFTNNFGALIHAGLGGSQLTSKNGFDGQDYTANGIFGVTGQARLSNRVVLTADLTGILNASQDFNFDGMGATSPTAVDGVIINITAGLTFYLGKNEKHADWIAEKTISDDLEKRLSLLEKSLLDSDKDGVADLYDLEPNSIAGVAVNTKGQSIDHNQNGVPDELESYLDKTYGKKGDSVPSNNNIEELINAGYVNVYFDSNSSKPTSTSLSGVGFIVKYLQSNPSKSVDVIGYADEIGSSSFNTELSRKRAEAVKEIAVKSGIDASRLNVIANGEDASVDKNSKEARQIVRRVSFKVK
ncbi:OmpA family protein [Flavobacterium sp. HJJ]|uniref:OmpA family protein n=1 Tax=Flavobacterium sp. HJJ TaxID=2783792 RepID=UPI00188BE148|nr:OmpA family protein [Flavobacterium sp. HJJ]MBF4472277.1 OmpA family protein [Flavobacterium sp. HJJ]